MHRFLTAAAVVAAVAACGPPGIQQGGDLVVGGGLDQEPPEPGSVVSQPTWQACLYTEFRGRDKRIEHITFPSGNLANSGKLRVTITDVSLVNPKHMTLVEASLFPVSVETKEGEIEYGVPMNWGYPPDPSLVDFPEVWYQRVPAVGAVFDPGDVKALGAVVKVDKPRAQMDRVRVEYQDSHGGMHEIFGTVQLGIDPDADCGY